MFPINFKCFSSPPSESWPQIAVRWLGHLLSFCTSNLSSLIERVACAASERFSPELEMETVDPIEEEDRPSLISPSLDPVTQDPPLSKVDELNENQANDPGNEQIQQVPQDQIVQEPPPQIKPVEEDAVLDLEDEDPAIVPPADENLQKPEQKHKAVPAKQPGLGPRRNYKPKEKENRKPILLPQLPKPPTQAQEKLPAPPPKTTGQPPVKPQTNQGVKPAVPLSKEKYEIKDCGGGGDCQLLSLLKGLKRKHPKLLEYKKEGKWVPYTDLDLREMGVRFAREQIDTKGPYYEEILGYLDTDRKEFNEDVVAKVKIDHHKELQKLDKDLKERKITDALYQKQRKALQTKYDKIEADVKANKVIQNDDDVEFLNRLEKKGFYCSTLHLFTLSAKLKVPIFVHKGIPGHNIDKFNPTESKLDPIHLLYLSWGHYQLIVYAK